MRKIVGIVVAMLCLPSAVAADPVTVAVNGANVYVESEATPVALMHLWHRDFGTANQLVDVNMSGHFFDPQPFLDLCTACSSGDTFNPSIVVSGDALGTVSAILGDYRDPTQRWDGLTASGEFALTAGAITLPTDAPELYNVFLPLTLSGFLTGSLNGKEIVHVQPFSFTGRASVQFRTGAGPAGTSVFKALSLNYIGGDSPDPVPEPATLLLLGTGLTGVAARRWRQQRQH